MSAILLGSGGDGPLPQRMEVGSDDDAPGLKRTRGTDGDAMGRRRRDMSELERRLESLIVRVGEKATTSLEKNIEGLASVLEEDLDTCKAHVQRIVATCVVDIPHKMTLYSTLVGLLNAKNHAFGMEFIELMIQRLRELMRNNQYDKAIVLTTMLSDLCNCRVVSPASLMQFLESFLDVASSAATSSDDSALPQVRTDWFAYVFLHALPWCGRTLSNWAAGVAAKGEPDPLVRAMDALGVYLADRRKLHVPMLSVWTSECPAPQHDYLDCLYKQVCNMRSSGWIETLIARHYLAFADVTADAVAHAIPAFVPPAHTADAVYPLPAVVFHLFLETPETEEQPLPPYDSVDRFVVQRELGWIIDGYYTERKECASILLAWGLLRPRVPLNYVILEVVFGQLFHLPQPVHLPLFYGCLLIELCKLQPNTMPQVMAMATELLYDRLDYMQPAAFDRFVDWLSYHLSNFQYRWTWDEWADCALLPALAPRRMFVQEVLQKVMRLSFHHRVCEIVPEEYKELLPSKPQPNFKYALEGADTLPGTAPAKEFVAAVRQKCTADEALDVLRSACPRGETDDATAEYSLLAVDVCTLSLLHLGSKTFSHSFAALTKYHSTLRALTSGNDEAQLVVLRCVYDLWSTHTQMVCVLVDKLLKMQIVECGAVVRWLFDSSSASMRDQLLRSWVWEIVEGTLVKLGRHMARLRRELADAKDRLVDAEASNTDASDLLGDAGAAGDQAAAAPMDAEEGERAEDDDDDGAEQQNGVDEKPKRDGAKVVKESRAAVDDWVDKLAAAENVQRNLLLTLFQNLTILLTEHLLDSEKAGTDFNTHWYRWVIGRMQHMFMVQPEEAAREVSSLEQYLFTSDVDPHILAVFRQFCALYS